MATATATTTTTSTPPMYKDHPLKTIPTPKFINGGEDDFTKEGSFMALSHNSFIRGFNSIYQQAPRLTSTTDKADFVAYALAWRFCVASHHHYEETDFFPSINKAAGTTDLMADAYEQHAKFWDGLDRFKAYLEAEGSKFDGAELIKIMDSFAEVFREHLAEEPQQIADLAKYSTAEHPIDILGLALAAGKKEVTPKFIGNILPVYFLNMELQEFENGMWIGVFPPVNAAVKWVMMKGAPMWHGQRRWRFASCSTENAFKQLAV